MNSNHSLKFKVAAEDWEFEAIKKLLYRTFVEEMPQYDPNPEQVHVDKFHPENTYLICVDDGQLAGMIALRDKRPFSLDQKLANLDDYLPPGRNICEIRFLAVEQKYRHSAVLPALLALLEKQGRARGFDTAVISGTIRQAKLYQHLGFVPFGPLVGKPGALYQPMMLTYERYRSQAGPALNAWRGTIPRGQPVNLLPGPVALHPSVRQAFARPPISHRSRAFCSDFQRIRQNLCQLVGASQVEIMLGSGTLANDAIAGQLSLLGEPGLILTNGEFGERLVDQARRFRISFDVLAKSWGEAFARAEVLDLLTSHPKARWLWMVHCETSTSVLNDMVWMAEVCRQLEIRLCLDCVSTIGTIPVDLGQIYFASAVSGKGLGSLAGLAMVFHNHALVPCPDRLPRYLDLGYYAEHDGIPFTHSSNLFKALDTALKRVLKAGGMEKKRALSAWLRRELQERGFRLIAPDVVTSPAVVTIALDAPLCSDDIGWKLEEAGFQLSYRSQYLLRRNWMQICLMGECRRVDLRRLVDTLTELCQAKPNL
jgi:aspartate aminotransferase-like enzyme